MPPKDYYTKDGSAVLSNMKFNIDDFAKFYASMATLSTLSGLYEILSEKADEKDEEDFNKLNKNYYG